jgi:hypothetical protein
VYFKRIYTFIKTVIDLKIKKFTRGLVRIEDNNPIKPITFKSVESTYQMAGTTALGSSLKDCVYKLFI